MSRDYSKRPTPLTKTAFHNLTTKYKDKITDRKFVVGMELVEISLKPNIKRWFYEIPYFDETQLTKPE